MFSDGSNSDGSSDLEEAARDKKGHKRSGGKSVEKKKKHDKHKKHKKSKKHKKHRHQSDDDSGERSDDGSVSSGARNRPQQPSPERNAGKEAKGGRGAPRGRDAPPEHHQRQDREERLLRLEGASSRWDSPGGEGEGRHVNAGSSYDHSKSQRTSTQGESRDDNSHRHDERYRRETNRRRSPTVARSRSPSADHATRGRTEYRERRRYSDEDNRRGGGGEASHQPGAVRYQQHYNRGNKNGRENRAASPTYQHNSNRFDDTRRPNRRNDSYAEYHPGGGSRRAQEHSGVGDDGRQRRYSPPNQSYRSQQQQQHQHQQRGLERPEEERDERQHRGDYRNEFRDQRAIRGPHAEQSRDWRGPAPDDRDRNRRERNEDYRERERGRESPRGGSRSHEVKVERISSSPVNARERDHNPVNRSESDHPGNRRGRDRSPRGPGPRRQPFRPGQENEEEQFEWGGGRRETDSNPRPHVPRGIKEEDRPTVKKEEPASDSESAPPKQKPNFGLSGKLTEETNKVNGTVIAYAEPPGARKPKRRWRLYPFKGEQALPTLYIHRQSCYLIGRDRKVCDLPVDHPSCSKQHAVLQYRLVPYQKEDGSTSQRVRPYIIDLESANGTFVNNKKIESKRYIELLEKDVLKFGFSSREYVLLHENSKEENEEDDGFEVSPTSKPFAGANSNVGPN